MVQQSQRDRLGFGARLRSWQPPQSPVPPEVEDSWLLRLLVQTLVIVGIIATDVAAADVVDLPWISLWAVPLSILGGVWSWYHRRDRNLALKFCLALGMLLVLAAFFSRLLQALNDTRLVLAELLIQLQVLHSFDLPRRRDLGYSVVIGLILLAVAATLSQTLSFAPFLLLFLAIALPVLTLDYRSRLQLIQGPLGQLWPRRTALAPSRMVFFFLVVIGLGLAVFMALPRLPGYQLRTFPVSATIETAGKFDSSQVFNPGYQEEGEEGEGSGRGFQGNANTIAGNQGRLDPTSYYGFNTEINQNLRGNLTPVEVMRVRSQIPGFWRVLAFDRYLGQGWEISRNDNTQIYDRSPWSYRYFLPRFPSQARTQEVVQTYTILADLPNLIPALAEPDSLYFPTRQVARDPEGSLRSPVELAEGLTYTVISEVPYRDRTALQQADQSYSEKIQSLYLQIPGAIAPRVRDQAKAILARAPQPITAPYEQALYLAQYLKQTYQIQPDLPFLEPEEDLVESFLFKYQGGYPDHFSTTLTILLRSIGVPARLAAGFAPGEFNPFTGYYLVRNTDAFSLTEVYIAGYGWFTVDPIPGHPLTPPSLEESSQFSTLQSFWSWVAGWLPSPVRSWLGQVAIALQSIVTRGWVGLWGLLRQGWWGLLQVALLGTGLAFGVWLLLQGGQALGRRWRLRQLAPPEQLYQELLHWLAQRGQGKVPSQTPLELARQVGDRFPPEAAALVQTILRAYGAWRYGDQTMDIPSLRRQFNHLKHQGRSPRFQHRQRSRGA